MHGYLEPRSHGILNPELGVSWNSLGLPGPRPPSDIQCHPHPYLARCHLSMNHSSCITLDFERKRECGGGALGQHSPLLCHTSASTFQIQEWYGGHGQADGGWHLPICLPPPQKKAMALASPGQNIFAPALATTPLVRVELHGNTQPSAGGSIPCATVCRCSPSSPFCHQIERDPGTEITPLLFIVMHSYETPI